MRLGQKAEILSLRLVSALSLWDFFCAMGGNQSKDSLDKEAEINTRAGDKKRMKKLDKDIRKTFFAKDMVAWKINLKRCKAICSSLGEKWFWDGRDHGAAFQGDWRPRWRWRPNPGGACRAGGQPGLDHFSGGDLFSLGSSFEIGKLLYIHPVVGCRLGSTMVTHHFFFFNSIFFFPPGPKLQKLSHDMVVMGLVDIGMVDMDMEDIDM